jgi:hypothetical protein
VSQRSDPTTSGLVVAGVVAVVALAVTLARVFVVRSDAPLVYVTLGIAALLLVGGVVALATGR